MLIDCGAVTLQATMSAAVVLLRPAPSLCLQVNRCARYANGASHGGQITLPHDVMEQIVVDFTGAECPAMQEQGNPHMLQVAAVCTALSDVSMSMFRA